MSGTFRVRIDGQWVDIPTIGPQGVQGIQGVQGTQGVPGPATPVPAGVIWQTISTTAPVGWIFMIGQTIVNGQTLYAALWAEIPAAWKSGSSIVFPDARGRVLMGAGTGAGLTARVLGAIVSNEETHALTAAETGVKGHAHGNSISASTPTVSTDHYHAIGGSTGNDTPDHSHTSDGQSVANYNVASRQAVAGAGWNFGIGGWQTGGASVRHTHPNPANTNWTSAAGGSQNPNHDHVITMAGGVTALTDGANGTAHNIMQPSIAFNTMIKT